MKKYSRIVLLFLLFALLVFTSFSCTAEADETADEESDEPPVVIDYANIDFIEVASPDELMDPGFLLSEFSMSSVRLDVTYYNGERVEMPASYSMVRAEDKAKLSVPGTHQITLYYGKFVIEFKLKLFNNVDPYYAITFKDFDGNRIGDVQYLKEGQVANVPNLPSVKDHTFAGWRKENDQSGALIDTFTFTSDTTLVAVYTPDYFTVRYFYVLKFYKGSNVSAIEYEFQTAIVKNGDDAYAYAPALPIIEGFSNGHWVDVDSMKNVSSDGLKFYAEYEQDFVDVTFVYYKYTEGEYYNYKKSYPVYNPTLFESDSLEKVTQPDDLNRTANEIFSYWYVVHDGVEVPLDKIPETVSSETIYYAKYIPVTTGSEGLEIKYFLSEDGAVDNDGYYISGYSGNDTTITIPNNATVSADVRYVFAQKSCHVGDPLGDNVYVTHDDYLIRSYDGTAQSGITYYDRYTVNLTNGSYYINVPVDDNGYIVYVQKPMTIYNDDVYCQEDIAAETILAANTYYYKKDNTYIFIESEMAARSGYSYFTRIETLSKNGTILFISEDKTESGDVLFLPQNKTKIIGLLNNPFINNGAKRFFVANGNTVFRINNDILYSDDLSVLYAYPTKKTNTSFGLVDKKIVLKEIAPYAFYNATNLTRVTLPLSLERIGAHAFEKTSLVDTVKIPANVIYLGERCFADASGISSFTFGSEDETTHEQLPSNLNEIGDYCFSGLYRLQTIALPVTLQVLGVGVFDKCDSLKVINLSNGYFTYDTTNGGLYGRYMDAQYYYLYAYPAKSDCLKNGSVVLNNQAGVIRKGAFSNVSLFEIVYNSSNNIIFEEGSIVCPTLRCIRLNCESISTAPFVAPQQPRLTVNTFYDSATNNFYLPEAFYLNTNKVVELTQCLDSDGIRNIDVIEYEFDNEVAVYVFDGDFGYEVRFGTEGFYSVITAYKGINNVLEIPMQCGNNVVRGISENAFRGNNAIEYVILPETITEIDNYAFYGCKSLKQVTLGAGVNFIGDYAFAACDNLTSVVSHEQTTIRSIGTGPFAETPFIRSVGSSENEIVSEFVIVGGVLLAYNGIEDTVVIPKSVRIIAEYALYNKTMSKVVFGDQSEVGEPQLREVHSYAFSECDYLKELYFPTYLSLDYLDDNAFSGCDHLFAVTFKTEVDYESDKINTVFNQSGSIYGLLTMNIFDLHDTGYSYEFRAGTLICDMGTDNYILSAPDIETSEVFEGWFLDSGLTEPASFPMSLSASTMFYAKTSAPTTTDGLLYSLGKNGYSVVGYESSNRFVTIPSTYKGVNVVAIGERAFYGKNVIYFQIPTSIQEIGMEAFDNTPYMNDIVDKQVILGTFLLKYKGLMSEYALPNNVSHIAAGAFSGNTYLEKITINNIVTTIPEYCFSGCSALTTIILGTNVSKIKEYAFEDCTLLSTVNYDSAKYLKTIHWTAFRDTQWIKNYSGDSIIINKVYYAYLGSNEVIHIKNSVELINPYAFYAHPTIRYVYIPESVITIGEYAFAESRLEKVFFADNNTHLNAICEGAFYGCQYAVDFNFRNCVNLTDIGEKAFYGVKVKDENSVLTYYIPAKLSDLGEYAFARSDVYAVYFTENSRLDELSKGVFENCDKLVSIRFMGGSDLKDIDDNAFYGCDNLRTFINDKATLLSIGENAFYGCSQLTVFGVNESELEYIGKNAFKGSPYTDTNDTMTFVGTVLIRYNGIQSIVHIPENTTVISNNAFDGNQRVSQVLFSGENLVTIQEFAFRGCRSVYELSLPTSVSLIEYGAFAGCDELASITFSDGLTGSYLSEGGVLFRYFADGDNRYAELIAYPNKKASDYTIPDAIKVGDRNYYVVGIADYAFYGCYNVNKLTLNASLSYIGENAFTGCYKLLELRNKSTLPLSIGSDAYGGVAKYAKAIYASESYVSKITITPDLFIYYTDNDHVILIGYTGNLTSLTLPEIITDIAPYALYRRNITELYMSSYVKTIGDNAFEECIELESLTVSSTLENIGKRIFSGCISLTTVIYGGTKQQWSTINKNDRWSDGLGKFVVRCLDGSTTMNDFDAYVFSIKNDDTWEITGYNNSSTSELIIPAEYEEKAVTSIGDWAFEYCSSLTSISIPDSVTSIGDGAFYYCSSLTNVTFGSGVTSIGWYAFEGCSSFTSITIPDSVTSIGSFAFSGCSSLTSITIGNSVTSIGDDAFSGCRSLTSVTIPDSVTSIGDYAFSNCTSLTSITIPDSVTGIGAFVFSGCSSLESITLPFIGSRAGVTSSDTYQYPLGYLFGTSSYTGGTGVWQYYYGSSATGTTNSYYYIPSTLRSVTVSDGYIPYGAFYNCTMLTSITLGENVTSIGNKAFENCSSLASVYYSGDIASWCGITFNDNPLYYARNLYINNTLVTEITIPDTVTEIKANAFYGWNGTSITIPDSVSSIGESAFFDCSNLTSVTIGNGVTSIENWAFSICTNLTSITFEGTKAQWNAISKGSDWNYNTGAYTIHCMDGDLEK